MSVFASCNRFLDEDPTDRLLEQDGYSNINELYLNAVAARYHDVGGNANSLGLQGTARGVYDLNTFTTDEAIIPTRGTDWFDGGLWMGLFLHDWNGLDPIGDTWNYLFKAIMGCNDGLQHINAYAVAHYDDVIEYRDEVRALRALFYFYAMDLYGRVPVFDSAEPTAEELKLWPRSKVWRYLINELLDCEKNLVLDYSNKPGKYYGRITAPVVWFLLAKLALNAEIYNDDNHTYGVQPDGKDIIINVDGERYNAWEAAILFCQRLEMAGYSLESDFSANFKVYNENSNENIFTIPADKYLYDNRFVNLFRSRHYNHASALGLNGENGPCATVEALRTFGYGADEDPRFDLTYYAGQVFDDEYDEVYLDDGTPLVYEPEEVKLDLTGSPYEKTAGARMKKYEVDMYGLKDGCLSDNDIVLFRFADVLLMHSEAEVRLNGVNDVANSLLNVVRSRVGAPEREATLDNLLSERMLELAWEGWRRNDLIRFGKFTRAYTDRPQLPGEENGYTIVFPIPGRILNLNPDQAQNPGY